MSRGTEETKETDILIGLRILERRLSLGLSRVQLSDMVSVTHQQMNKYEKATNRVSASRLKAIARALRVSISYFFDEEEVNTPNAHQRMGLEVTRNFHKIKNPEHQSGVNVLVRSLAEG